MSKCLFKYKRKMHMVVFYNHTMKSFIKVRAEKLIFTVFSPNCRIAKDDS